MLGEFTPIYVVNSTSNVGARREHRGEPGPP